MKAHPNPRVGLADEPASGSAAPADRQRVLFIGGLGRSGTTVIERMLNELPQAFAEGESIFLWKRGLKDGEQCGCGEPFRSCPHWSAVGERAFGGWDEVDVDKMIALRWEVDRTRRVPGLLFHREHERLSADQRWYLDHLVRVMLASARVAGRPPLMIDSSKHLSAAALLTLDPRLDLRVLHLVRDARGVAHSRTRTRLRPEAGNVAMSTLSPRQSALRWVTDNLGYEALGRRGVPMSLLRYEDFMADPHGAMVEIGRFAGVDLTPADLGFLEGRTAHFRTPMHSAAGNPVRFGGDDLEIRIDSAWREQLPVPQRRLVTAIAAPLLLRYRYPLRP